MKFGQCLMPALLLVAGPALAKDEPFALTGIPGPAGETLTLDEKGITLAYPDDAAKLRIGGKLQLDFGAASVRQPGFGEPLTDNIGVRRSWIESYLTLGKVLELAFQYDFADAETPINDAVAAIHVPHDVLLSVGNMKEPFSLDQLTGDTNTLFTERSLADAFAPGRNFGGAVGTHGKDWTAVAGVFGGNANTGIGQQGIAATGRLTYAPIHESDHVLHLGLAGSYRSLSRTSDGLAFSSQAEASLLRQSFVDTDAIAGASSVARLGLEAAYQSGPFLIQAEYIDTRVERFDGRPNLGFRGGYVQGSVILNGQRMRSYKLNPDYGTTYAVFSGVVVPEADRVSRGGFGVFELGARFSAIDLQDRDVTGGIERDVTVGLNWYPDRNVRIMADYIRSHTSPSAISGFRTIDADTVIGRFQVYW